MIFFILAASSRHVYCCCSCHWCWRCFSCYQCYKRNPTLVTSVTTAVAVTAVVVAVVGVVDGASFILVPLLSLPLQVPLLLLLMMLLVQLLLLLQMPWLLLFFNRWNPHETENVSHRPTSSSQINFSCCSDHSLESFETNQQ